MKSSIMNLSKYLSGIPNLNPEDMALILVQAHRFFEYCHDSARDSKSEDSAQTFREWVTKQTSDEELLHQTNQALHYWTEYSNRYLSPTPELDLLTSRPGIVSASGTMSFLLAPLNREVTNQTFLFPKRVGTKAGESEWLKTCNDLAKEMQTRGMSWKTQASYLGNWKRFRKFISVDVRPCQVSWQDATSYHDYLLHEKKLSSASIRSSTFSLKFIFENILHSPLGAEFKKPMPLKPRKPPVVLSRKEVNDFLNHVEGPRHLLFSLLYGCGMRLNEGLSLRIKDIDFENRWILILDGKGSKGRHVPLPEKLVQPLRIHIDELSKSYEYDLIRGIRPWMPASILRSASKNRNDKLWQWIFPSKAIMDYEGFSGKFRWHVPPSGAQRSFSAILARAGIAKHASSHTLRHSFATHLIQNGVDIKTLQRLLGHSDMETTAKYLHVFIDGPTVQSPLDYT